MPDQSLEDIHLLRTRSFTERWWPALALVLGFGMLFWQASAVFGVLILLAGLSTLAFRTLAWITRRCLLEQPGQKPVWYSTRHYRFWLILLSLGLFSLVLPGFQTLGKILVSISGSILVVRGIHWLWERLLFKVSRRLWVILGLVSFLPLLGLTAALIALAWLGIGATVSRSIQHAFASTQESLRRASLEVQDSNVLKSLETIGAARIRYTARLPEKVEVGFVGLVYDADPTGHDKDAFFMAVTGRPGSYRLISLPMGKLAEQAVSLAGGRMHYRLDWDRDKNTSARSKKNQGTQYKYGPKEEEQKLLPFQLLGAHPIRKWSTGESLKGTGLNRPFQLPSLQMPLRDWSTGQGLLLTLTPETNLTKLSEGYDLETRTNLRPSGETIQILVEVVLGIIALAISQFIALFFGLRLSRNLGHSVDSLARGVKHLANGDFSLRLHPLSRDQVGRLTLDFNRMAERLEASLSERELRLHLQEELRVAREVQMRLLPNLEQLKLPSHLQATILPAQDVAGDFYDLFKFEDGSLAFLIADVSGKGTSAAFYAAETNGMITAMEKDNRDPRDLVIRLNDIWCGTHPKGLFLTLIYGRFRPWDGRFAFVRCGHTPAFVLRAGESPSIERLCPKGLAIGLHPKRFEEILELEEGWLQPGDRLILYTDGLTEALNAKDELFGEDRFVQSILAAGPDLSRCILKDVLDFTGSEVLSDDLTFLVLGR